MPTRTIDGPVVHPTNRTYQHRGSIHDDATAQELGFRGGTIAASTHLDAFPPVLLEAFGERWFTYGCLSLYFRHATTDGEPVRVHLDVDGDAAAAALVTPDGTVVADGTASVGAEASALRARDLRHDPAGLRILARLAAGDTIGPNVTRCPTESQAARVADGLVVSPLDWYTGPSPWGGPVAAPSSAIAMFTDVAAGFLLRRIESAVGLWGAMELRFHGRPLRCDDELTVTGAVVAVGQTPRTETLWYDLTATGSDGVAVASTRVLTRFAKASSALYDDPTS
jgi:hypothetical protein